LPPTEQTVLDALKQVRYPGFTRDIVSFGIVRAVTIEEDRVRVRLDLGPGSPAVAESLQQAVRDAIEPLDGVAGVDVRVGSSRPTPGLRMAGTKRTPSVAAQGGLDSGLLPNVRHVVAVASGKGGVGKSTVAVNLAAALAQAGARVGLLDADIYGPSIPLMMGVDEQPRLTPEGRRLVPFVRHGVHFMSLGFLVPGDAAVIWRGPMVMKAVEQLLRDVDWGALDVLVVDMPPGTGDAQLTLSQRVRLAGAVIVTTPQDVALADAIKGVNMFRKVDVPVLGLIENMSGFVCPHCNERSEIFGHGGGRREAERLGVPFLGEIPLDGQIRDGGDRGTPIVRANEDSACSATFRDVAQRLLGDLDGGDGPPATDDRGLFERFRDKFGG
jgi:ATP-binding protein involved in chromosome partitioning